MQKFEAVHMPRHQRMQEILNVLREHTRRYYPAHPGLTMYGVAHAMDMSPSSNITSMIKELQREGLVDGYDVIHRTMPGDRDDVVKTYWYLSEYPPAKQQRMDGF